MRPLRLAFAALAALPFLAGAPAHADESGVTGVTAGCRLEERCTDPDTLALSRQQRGEAAPPGFTASVRGDDPLKPVMTLTNSGASPCQVVTSAVGTVAIRAAVQSGHAIAPVPVNVAIEDGTLWAGRWHTLAPGASVEIPLNVVKSSLGHVLESVSWSGGTGFGALYVLQPGQPVDLDVTYAVPVAAEGEIPACPPALSGAQAAEDAVTDEDDLNLLLYGSIAGAVLVVGLVLVLVITGRRRRRAATAAVLLLAGLAVVGWPAQEARADFSVAPPLQGAFDDCMELLRQPGNDPAGILPALDDPDMNVQVVETNGDVTHAGVIDRRNGIIFWDPDDRHAYFGSGGNADPCTSLYHEMHHVWQGNQGTYSTEPCSTPDPAGRTLERTEVLATKAQNALRRLLGMPERTHYGDIPLPAEGCHQPPNQLDECRDSNCGDSNGDPHLLTFDNMRYDFQAAGEFVLARSTEPDDGFEVQVRQEPYGDSRVVAVNTAVAMAVGQDRVEVRATPQGLVLVVGGQVKPLQGVRLPGGGEVEADRSGVVVSWKDGPRAFVRRIGPWGLHIALQPVAAQLSRLEGLLGDFDGDSANDIRPRGGDPIEQPTFAALYPTFADSWRVDASTSLFAYEPGTGPETYVDKGFPESEVDIDRLPNRAAAEALCRRVGVDLPEVLQACILDVALTGQADFAVAATAGQVIGAGGDGFAGTRWKVTIDQPGQIARLEFPGTKGQKVFVDIAATTVPDQCSGIGLLGPDGKRIAAGCVVNGQGHIDTTVLPVDGTYTIEIDPDEDALGEALVRLIPVTDQEESISADGPQVVAVVDRPGEVSRFTFAGAKDQKVFLDIPFGTLPDQCGGLDLLAPDGRQIATGCTLNGSGYIDAVVLPADGTYTIVVNPADRHTGQARLRLVNVVDQEAEISVGGPPVDLRLRQPGAAGRFTFTAATGQRVTVEVSSSTLPDGCGVVLVRGPDGRTVAGGGCVFNGAGELTAVIPQQGRYTLVIDPAAHGTGAAVVRIRT